jgi:hypothetical protein
MIPSSFKSSVSLKVMNKNESEDFESDKKCGKYIEHLLCKRD